MEIEDEKIITLIELKQILNTYDEYDSEGDPAEVYLPSGRNLTSPLSYTSQNAQKTVFLDYLGNDD